MSVRTQMPNAQSCWLKPTLGTYYEFIIFRGYPLLTTSMLTDSPCAYPTDGSTTSSEVWPDCGANHQHDKQYRNIASSVYYVSHTRPCAHSKPVPAHTHSFAIMIMIIIRRVFNIYGRSSSVFTVHQRHRLPGYAHINPSY